MVTGGNRPRADDDMFSRVAVVIVVRQSSRSAFKLPPTKFRYSPLTSQDESMPVITSPTTLKEETQKLARDRKRGKGGERLQRKQKLLRHPQARHENDLLISEDSDASSDDAELFKQSQKRNEKSLLMSEDSNTSKNYTKSHDKPWKTKFTGSKYATKIGTKFTTKSPSQSVENTLASMGINAKGEIIFGIFPVFLALQVKRRTIYQLIYKSGSGGISEKIQNILTIAEEQGVPIVSLKPSQFKRIFQGDQVHQGVCCDASPLPFVTLDEDHPEQQGEDEQGRDQAEKERKQREGEQEGSQVGRNKPEEDDRYIHEAGGNEQGSHQDKRGRKHKLWLYLDHIQDPMNFGTVLRSAYFMGVDRVLTSETFSTRITSTVSKASAGVAEVFPVYEVKDPVKLASSLTQGGWELVSSVSPSSGGDGGDGDDDNTSITDVTAFRPKGNVLLVVGNEGKGISPELQQMCQIVLTITPGRSLHPHLQCLNVSVATALLLHGLLQRLSPCRP